MGLVACRLVVASLRSRTELSCESEMLLVYSFGQQEIIETINISNIYYEQNVQFYSILTLA